jgi:predicted molibdopterin-dependent oxidoreductase YjgC
MHHEAYSYFGIDYEELKNYETIIILNTDITRSNPVVATFVKQAKLKGAKIITIGCEEFEISKHSSLKIENVNKLVGEIEGRAVLIHHPEYETNLIPEDLKIEKYSISHENNTSGLYFLDIRAEEFIPDKYEFIYSLGEIVQKKNPTDFLVVQGVFKDRNYGDADVVLPMAVWVEYEGTYISSESRVNLVEKVLEPPQGAKPTWEIFKAFFRRMELGWDYNSPEEIWRNGILKQKTEINNLTYQNLRTGGMKIEAKISMRKGLFKKKVRENSHKVFSRYCEGLKQIAEKRIKGEI